MHRKTVHTTILTLTALLFFVVLNATAQEDCTAVYGEGAISLRLATGSPGELGLVEVLAEAFNQNHDTRLCWKKAGSGASLKLLQGMAVDVVMVHAPAAEKNG